MKLLRLETDLLRVPLRRPVSLSAIQEPRPTSTVDVVLVGAITDGPHVGLGFAPILGGGATAVRSLIDTVIADVVVGANPFDVESHFVRASAHLGGLGFAGVAARAYAAVDFALWDLKGKAAGLPVHHLLGGHRRALKAIVSDTASSVLGSKQAIKESLTALAAGAAGIQIEVGSDDPELDADRLRQLRDGIPDGAWFEIAAGGRLDFSSAVWLGVTGAEEFGLDGFCDPIPLTDTANLQRLITRLDVGVSVGAHADRPDDLLRLLDAGGVSAIRLDPLRLGGITPARKVAAAAELRHVAIYPVRLPEIGTHLGAASVYGRVCEYVDWFTDLFTGGPTFQNNQLRASADPGLGLTLNDDYAAKCRL